MSTLVHTRYMNAAQFIGRCSGNGWIMVEIVLVLATVVLCMMYGYVPSLDKVKMLGPYANRVYHREFFTPHGNAVSVFYPGSTIPNQGSKRKKWLNYEGSEGLDFIYNVVVATNWRAQIRRAVDTSPLAGYKNVTVPAYD